MALVSIGNLFRGLLHVVLLVARVAAFLEIPVHLALLASFLLRDLPWSVPSWRNLSLPSIQSWFGSGLCRADTFRNDVHGQRAIAAITAGIVTVTGCASAFLPKLVR